MSEGSGCGGQALFSSFFTIVSFSIKGFAPDCEAIQSNSTIFEHNSTNF